MSKVLALLTLGVLAFSAMTGPAFAPPIGQIGVRTYGHVEEYWGPALRSHPPVVDRELGRGFGLESKRYLPSRQPGYLDNGIFGSKPRF